MIYKIKIIKYNQQLSHQAYYKLISLDWDKMESPITVVKQYLNGWIRHDPEEIQNAFEENGVYIDPLLDAELNGPDIGKHAKRYFKMFPDLSFEGIGSITESSGLFAVQWIMRGSNSCLHDQPNGKPISIAIPGTDFMFVVQNKIRSVQAYYDHRMIPSPLLYAFDGRIKMPESRCLNTSMQHDHKNSGKYLRSPITTETSKQIKSKIVHLMENEKLFRDCDLNLFQLAKAVGHSTNHVSQVINNQLQKNFNDLVNSYRVEEAKQRLLKKNNQESILDIAFEVGFASKSSFNAIFKKHTQITPSRYIENQK